MKNRRTALVSGAALLAAIAVIGLSGCQTLGGYMPSTVGHPVVGVWEYQYDEEFHRREFTIDGKCIMYRGRPVEDEKGNRIKYTDDGEAYLIYDFEVLDETSVVVKKADRRGKGQIVFEVLADGRLSCESKYIAYRLK